MLTSQPIAFAHARYRAGAELGRGAQGAVLEVQDREDPERALVAKLYRPGLVAEAALRGEFALLARMRVPGLVRAHDLSRNELDGAPFLVEDRIDGPDALQWVQQARAQRVERLLRVLVGTARSLAALHEAGFLHGDLKPAHVRIAGELPVLLDLGAATAAAAQARVQTFTRSYAAPEVRAGGRADPRSDLYGLGALAWAAAVGCTPGTPPEALRTRAAWVPPRIADLIDRLLALHPQDRVSSALELLGLLGQAAQLGPLPAAIARGSQLQELLAPSAARVRYLVGEPGSGKSHLLCELRVRALLDGRCALLLDAREGSAAWLSVLRGQTRLAPGAAQLLLVDGLDDGPSELTAALESYRVLEAADARLRVIAATRSAPAGAERIELGALSSDELGQLAAALGVPEAARAQLVTSAAGNPGWLVAALGRVPLTAAAVEARTRDLSPGAREALAVVAAVGGRAPTAWLRALLLALDGEQEALQAGLLGRRLRDGEPLYEIEASGLCAELTRTLASPQLIGRLARVLLAAERVAPRALLALAGAAAPDVRGALLAAAARGARSTEARQLEIDALLALGRDPGERTLELLARLERLLRDAGRHAEHGEVVSWLEAAAAGDPRIRTLALRRAAEQRARAGDKAAALQLADEVLEGARRSSDALGIAQALATRGAVSLFSSDHSTAAVDLQDARARFAQLEQVEDREELARLDHNLGVVATYRGELERAREHFEAALRTKQALGDRAGMRACLRNLGYAALHAGDYAEAARWLDQALALARSLGQVAGEAWSLVTIAELEARRGDAVRAERQLAELEALPGELPAALRADVALVRAELALLAADFAAFDAAITSIDPELRRSDAQVDANSFILLARAGLARRRAAASFILAALRRARAARLALPLREARRVLVDVWRARARRGQSPGPAVDSGSTAFIETLSTLPGEQVIAAFARHLLAVSAAERVFVLRFEDGEAREVLGLDMDGLGIAEPERRVELVAARAALARAAATSEPTADGRGARIWLGSHPLGEQRWLALAEQRFLPDAFGGLGHERLRELTALLTLSARLAASAQLTAATASGSLASSSALPTITPRHSFPGIIGSSRALRGALARLDAAIDSDLPLLLTGETGVGKELFARAVAELGPRRGRPFVAVNCAAIAGSLFEAEFFGHERGAFTGAERRRSGVFVQADGGVLLLDEVGELSLAQQVALLRALETQRVRPLGGDGERKFDVRLIAATNRDLEQAVAEGSFRRDLLYRINVLEVRIPPLRERADDIEALALHFLRAHGSRVSISAPALRAMTAYGWPGNVRELAHAVQRLSALHDQSIELAHLPRHMRAARTKPRAVRAISARRAPEDPRDEVLQTLEQTGGNISHAARVLGLTRHGLKKRMLRLGLRRPRGETA